MPLQEDTAIAGVLQRAKNIALLGASHKPARPSHSVMQFLLSHGYTVFPVNPGLAGSELLGQRVYGTLDEVPGSIDMVDVFRNASFLPGIVEETINKNIPMLWTQLDVIDESAAAHAEKHGVRVVMNRCPAIEWPRLRQAGLL
ncbi:MAG: CoA-binding protein [Halioglobus sp.]